MAPRRCGTRRAARRARTPHDPTPTGHRRRSARGIARAKPATRTSTRSTSAGICPNPPVERPGRRRRIVAAVVRLSVNGVVHEIEAAAGRSLLDVVREELGLTGTKYGCGTGDCGRCTVLRGDTAIRACTHQVADLDGAAVTTVEGLADSSRLHPIQEAFVACRALQCGYCTPGMVMSAVALLRAGPAPDETGIRAAMAGNICRCGGYQNVVRAIRAASDGVPADHDDADHDDAGDADRPAPVAIWTAIVRLDDGTARDWG